MRRVLLLALLGSLVACAGTSEGPSSSPAAGATKAVPAEYERLTGAALSYLESGKPERAVKPLERAVALAPERPEAHVLWGRALAMVQDLAGSAAHYEKARALGSRDRQLFLELASVYDISQRYDEAIGVYEAWLAQDPHDVEMLAELGLTLLLRQRYPDAAGVLARAVELAPLDLQLRQDWGFALLRVGEIDRAAEELGKVLTSEPERPEAMRFLAQARAAQGREQEALELLDRLLRLAPTDAGGLRIRARLRLLSGQAQGALDDYGALLAAAPQDGAALLGAAGAFTALGRVAEAQKVLEQARGVLGDVVEVRLREAQLAVKKGDRGALQRLHEVAREMPQSLEAWRAVHAAARAARDKKLEVESGKHLVGLGARPD